MPPATAARRQAPSFTGYLATSGAVAERTAAGALPGHPLAPHIDDFLTDLANVHAGVDIPPVLDQVLAEYVVAVVGRGQ